jgi:ribosomal protein S27AE
VTIRFCPMCGAGSLEWRVPRRDDRPRQTCAKCGYVHYVGPALAAGVSLKGEIDRFVGVYPSCGPQGRPVVIVVYAGRLMGGGPGGSEEVQEVRWFGPADLPWDEFAFPSTVTALRDFLTNAPPRAPA